MILEEAWNKFALSGKISDYLNYVEIKDLKEHGEKQDSSECRCVSDTRNECR